MFNWFHFTDDPNAAISSIFGHDISSFLDRLNVTGFAGLLKGFDSIQGSADPDSADPDQAQGIFDPAGPNDPIQSNADANLVAVNAPVQADADAILPGLNQAQGTSNSESKELLELRERVKILESKMDIKFEMKTEPTDAAELMFDPNIVIISDDEEDNLTFAPAITSSRIKREED